MKLWKRSIPRKKSIPRKRLLALLLLICVLAGQGSVAASQSQLDAVNENIDKLEEEKVKEENLVNSITQSQSLLSGELEELNNSLSEIAAKLTETEEKRKRVSADLESTQKEREAVQEKEQEYHESMKMRIRFLYENGDEYFLSLLLEAKSFTEVLNKVAYMDELHEYDRKMLAEYQRLREDVSWKEEKLKQEEQELKTLEQELYESRVEAGNLITKIKSNMLSNENRMEQAQNHAKEYETLIASQKEYERELEAEKEREEERQQEQWRQSQEQGAQNTYSSDVVTTDAVVSGISYNQGENDLDLLAAIIECEADGESHEGKLAVGSVVINRINSPRFPNSMMEVLYQNRQFTPVGSGRFAVVLARGANSNCYAAASEVLAGKITLNSLFFRTNNGSKQGTVIGNHVFY